MYDITPLFVYHHIHYRRHHIHILWHHMTLCHHMHCTHDITPTISDIASIVFVSSQPLYWSSQTYSMYDFTPTLCMTSYAPYITSHPLFKTSHHCSHHITSTAFMTSHTLYMTSHTWQHKRCICHLTHYIWHYIHCICVIKPSVSVIPHPLSGWHHTHSMYDIILECMA